MVEPTWLDDNIARVGDTTFLATDDRDVYLQSTSTDERFVVVKSRRYLQRCIDEFRTLGVANLVEAGIWEGGSVAFFNLALEPRNHLAFDLWDRGVPALERFVDRTPSLTVEYGVDQGDADALTAAVQRRFRDEPIDLIIDDASHLYEPSRTMFEVLFPLLRPGGWYVIEDWQWSHRVLSDEMETYFGGRRGLSNLAVEAMIVAGDGRLHIIEQVTADAYRVVAVRGQAELNGPIDLNSVVVVRGGFTPTL